MLSKQHRLAKTKEISRVYARGRGFFSPYFSLKAFFEKKPTAKFAVVVSTKVSKKATLRNRFRRVVREYIRLHMELFRPGDYIVTIKPIAAKLSGAELREKFTEFIDHAFKVRQ